MKTFSKIIKKSIVVASLFVTLNAQDFNFDPETKYIIENEFNGQIFKQ